MLFSGKAKTVVAIFLVISQVQAAQILLEEDVVKLALERNEVSEITKNQVEQAQVRIKQAKSSLYPTLKANAQINKTWVLPTDSAVSKATDDNGWTTKKAEITLTQPIYTFGRLRSGIDLAKYNNELTKTEAKATLAEIKKAARMYYYNAVFYKTMRSIAQESLNNANKNAKALNDRVQFGRINQNDNLKMQADVAARKPMLAEATKGYEAALADLSAFLNVPESQLQNVPSELDRRSHIRVAEVSVGNLADIQAAKTQLKLAAAQAELAGDDYFPVISAFATYLPTNSNLGGTFGNSMFYKDQGMIGLRIDWEMPLGGGKFYEKKAVVFDKMNADLNVKKVTREVTTRQESLIRQFKTLEEKDKALQDAARLANKSYQVALQNFKTGGVSQLQLNDSEILLTNQKLNLVENHVQMKVLLAELERLQTEGK